ncbi:MAG: hypothetical protein COB43_09005 [Oceanospirillales bacterium]|jgi:uncharacterized membrane protein YfcA|nr:MAG: hypothetical protein COB43_09005 [Oceanospirillales bacterium]
MDLIIFLVVFVIGAFLLLFVSAYPLHSALGFFVVVFLLLMFSGSSKEGVEKKDILLAAFLGAAKFTFIAGIAASFLLTCSEHSGSGATWCGRGAC